MIQNYDIYSNFEGDGSTSAYTFDFLITKKADLKILILNVANEIVLESNGNDTSMVSSVVFDSLNGGGTVTLLSNLTTGYEIYLILDPAEPVQTTSIRDKSNLNLRTIEQMIDYLTTNIQRLNFLSKRSIRKSDAKILESTFDMTFPDDMMDVTAAGCTLVVNDTGTGLMKGPNAAGIEVSLAQAQAAEAAATGAQAAAAASEANALSAQAAAETAQTNAEAAQTAAEAAVATIGLPVTANRALVSDGTGNITVSPVTDTQIGYLSGATSAISGNSQSATLQNKTLDNTNTITVKDNSFTIQDNSDTTKQLNFELSSITTATTRTLTVPNESGTLITAATVTTKGDLIAATGSGAVSRLAAGTNNHALIADSAQSTGLKYANIGVAKNILKTTSGTKTPSATNHYHSLTSNSISLTAGTWELTGYANFSNSGSPSYTDIGVAWWGANGADSSSAPTTALSGVSGLTIDSAYGGGVASYFNLSTQACQIQAPTTIVTLTTTQTIYIVTFATMTTAANARITAYMTARQLY